MSKYVLRVDGGWADRLDVIGTWVDDEDNDISFYTYSEAEEQFEALVFGTRQEALDWREVELPAIGISPYDAWPHEVAA